MESYLFQLFRILLFISLSAFSTFGQEKIDCDSYLYKSNEQIFRAKSRGGEISDKYLIRYIQQCPNSQYFEAAKKLIAVALEENTEHRLKIAQYYLKKYEEKKIGIIV